MNHIQNKSDKGTMPLYRQISEELIAKIGQGSYKKGDRLPSEAALAAEKQVSIGTVKHAYGELERRGLIYKVRGGGSYVSDGLHGIPEDPEQSPQDIVEQTVREMSQSGLEMSRLYAVLKKQIRIVFSEDQKLTVALVDCNEETLHHLTENLEQLPGLDIKPYLLDDLFSGKEVIGSQCRLALVSDKHYTEFIRYADPLRIRTEEVALRESRETIARISVIPDAQEICVLYRSPAFLECVQYTLKWMGKRNSVFCIREQQLEQGERFQIQEKTPLIIPPDYSKYSCARALQIIGRARKWGNLIIPFEFEIDKGSLLHLKRMLPGIREREAENG